MTVPSFEVILLLPVDESNRRADGDPEWRRMKIKRNGIHGSESTNGEMNQIV
jgi:hypothetical protein